MNKMQMLAAVPALAVALAAAPAAFGAQDLVTVYQQAAQSDPQLKAAEAAYRAALEAKPQARAGLLPEIGANAGVSRNRYDNANAPNSSGTVRSWTLDLQQMIYRRDRFVQLKQADASIGQADAQYASARQNLIVRVAQGYFGVLSAADNVTFAQSEKAAIGRQLEQARKRFEVGMIAITDVHEAKAAYDSAAAKEIAARNALANAKESLREITGAYYDNLAQLGQQMPLVSPQPKKMEAWTKTAEDQNLQLKASEYATQVAKEGVDLQRSGHYPTLDLTASYGYYKGSFSGFAQADRYNGSIGLQLNVPIYQGGGVNSRIRQAMQQYYQARDNQEVQRRATLRETRDAYRGVLTGISQVQALHQAVISNESALEATQAGFEVGTRTIVDVLLAESNLYGAKRDYAQSRYDYILNSLKLKQAAGTLSVDDIKQINGWLQ